MTSGVVLVEGVSDQAAVVALAARLGRDLDAEGVVVVPMGGATGIATYIDNLLRVQGFTGRLAGLCDEGELDDLRRGLERAGLGERLTRAGLEELGFYACVVDLEDELIRSLGTAALERIVDGESELGAFRTLQRQPAWRGRPAQDQLRRFIGAKSGRKIRYGRLLVDALDLNRIPRPLARVLDHV